MKNDYKSKGIYKHFFLIFLTLLSLTLAIMTVFLIQDVKSQRQILKADQRHDAEMMRWIASSKLKSVFSDLIYLSTHPVLRKLLEKDQPSLRQQLTHIFLDFCKTSCLYDQVRFLDETGWERIRINFDEGRSYIVPGDELQNKDQRYYFNDTFKLEPGRVFVSPLDLNIEKGQIEMPLKPMIRFGSPVVNLEGIKQGIVLFNYFGNDLIQELSRASTDADSNIMLLNSEGYWLKGPRSEDEWGFMYEDRKNRTLARRVPQVWQKIKSQDEGQVSYNHGIYTFTTIYPLSHSMKSSSGSGKAFEPSFSSYQEKEYYWKIVSFLSPRVLHERNIAILLHWLPSYTLVTLLVGFVSFQLSLFTIHRKKEKEAINKAYGDLEMLVERRTAELMTTNERLQKHAHNLGERMKELRCLYETMNSIRKRSTLEEIFQDVLELIPQSWQYPEITRGKIRFDGKEYVSEPFEESEWKQSSDILVKNEVHGIIEVFYLEEKPEHDEGPFLKEERNLIDGITRNLGEYLERQHALNALQKKENQVRLLLNSTAEAIYGLDIEGNCAFANRACMQVLGYKTTDELIGQNMHNLIHHSYPDATPYPVQKCPIYQAFQKEEYIHVDNEVLWRADGTSFPAEYWSYPIIEDDQIKGAVVTFMDISKRKELEVQLFQAQKMEAIGTLAGGIAHDFNNILSPIIGYTELILLNTPEKSKTQQGLEEILNASHRAKSLVAQILAFSRQTELEMKPVEVKYIIKEVLKLLRASLPTTINIKENIKSVALVMCDPTQIHQILMNLCTNASHAMQEKGGVLEVSLENIELYSDSTARSLDLKPGSYLNLTVSDTGHGMTPDVLEQILDPFFTTKEKGEGTGMGLSVIHGIVKSYGGSIYAYSEPEKGSNFKVFLPIIESRLEPEKRVEKPISKGTERILFIDDEKALVEIGKQLLEFLGYDVRTRTSSIEALELFKAQPDNFDLVITDQTMPNMTGVELTKELRQIHPDIPIIICTGFSEQIDERKAEEKEISAYVMKPIIMREIANTIREVLDEK